MKPTGPASSAAHALKCELAGEVLRSSGKLRLQVTGWSMLPAVWPGDTLILEHVNTNAVSEGDIVLFSHDRRLFAHRVVKRRSEDAKIQTRGDAMPQPDRPVSDGNLLGKVSFIVRDGKAMAPARSLGFPQRAAAALMRRSEFAARLVAGLHGRLQALRGQNPSDRAVSCES